MGKELQRMYDEVKEQFGEISLYRLILRTKITYSKAKELPDSEENLSLVKSALDNLEITLSHLEKQKQEKKERWWKRLLRRRRS